EIASETAPEWESLPIEAPGAEPGRPPERPYTPEPESRPPEGGGLAERPSPGPAGTEGEDTGSRRSRRSQGGPGSGGYRTF
ncbi:MAG: hypothetical protein ACKOQ5_00390, partial [Solirubrobacterales bacterium]